MAFIDFTNGEVLTADQMDTVMRQSVMKFADATARDTALSAVLAEGMMCYLDDTNEVLKYDGASWIDISGDITGVTAGTALTGGGTSGNVTLDVDETALTIAQSQVTDLTTDLAGKQDDVITTQGDLVIGDVSGNPVRLPVGSADQVLTSDGTTVSFQDAAGGSLPGFTKIADVTLSGSSTTVTGISGYKNYQIRLNNVSNGNDGVTTLLSGWNGDNTGHKVLLGITTNASGITLDEIGNSAFFNVFRQIENSGAGNGLVSIFNADNNGYANVFVQGAPESNTNGSRGSVGQALILKNSQPLNSFVVECNGGAFDEGTVEVWAQ